MDGISATALVTTSVMRSLGASLCMACRDVGLDLRLHKPRGGYRQLFAKAPNVITWGVHLPVRWYRSSGTNVLFMENGLCCQKEGCWMDARGWFSDSALCLERHYDEVPDRAEMERLDRIARHMFGWLLFEGGDPSGPVLFAGQLEGDMSPRFYFPRREGSPLESALRLLREHLPERRLLVRPHPKAMKKWWREWPRLKRLFRPGWELDLSADVYRTLRGCSAVVTINSTLGTEALSLGLPVATLGTGAFSGAGVVLECADEPRRLSMVGQWEPSRVRVVQYLCSVLRHQVSYGSSPAEVSANREFQRWVGRANECDGEVLSWP